MNQIKAGAALSYIVIILNILLGVLYTPFMLRMLGQAEYGIYSLAISVIGYLTVLDLGFGNAIVRYTARFRSEGKREEQYEMFGLFFRLYIAIGLVALAIGLMLMFNVETFFGGQMNSVELDRMRIMMILMSLNLAFTFPLSIFGSIITAYENFVFQKVIAIVRSLLNPLVMVLLLTMGYKAVAMVVVTTVFNLLTLVVNWWYCRNKLHIKLYFRPINWGFLKEVSLYSFWIFLNAIMDQIYWGSGQFILGIYQGAKVVAIYAVAIQLKNMYFLFSTAISGLFLPKVSAMVARNTSDREISDLFVRTGRIQYLVMLFILSAFIVLGRPFITLWAGAEYDEAYTITLLFFCVSLVPLIQNVGIVILQARNQMQFRSTLYIILAVLSIAIAIPLSMQFGGLGCAIATSAMLVLGQGIIMNIYYKKAINLNIGEFWYEIFKISIAPTILVLLSLYFIQDVQIDSISSFLVAGAAYSVLYIPLVWFCSMNSEEKALFGDMFNKVVSRFNKA